MQQRGVGAELIAETLEARYGQTNEEALAREHLERKRLRKPEPYKGKGIRYVGEIVRKKVGKKAAAGATK